MHPLWLQSNNREIKSGLEKQVFSENNYWEKKMCKKSNKASVMAYLKVHTS